MDDRIRFMNAALACARKAFSEGEVPIGAVVVCDGKIIGRGHNRRTKLQLATAHAEIEAIDKACRRLHSWRLPECDVYVTLEPCPMCMGAMLNARIRKVYFGAPEGKGRSMTDELASSNLVNHRIEVEGGIMADRCAEMLTDFFSRVRCDERQG